jgi:hypothetical protein
MIHKQVSKHYESNREIRVYLHFNLCGVDTSGTKMDHYWKNVNCKECLALRKDYSMAKPVKKAMKKAAGKKVVKKAAKKAAKKY